MKKSFTFLAAVLLFSFTTNAQNQSKALSKVCDPPTNLNVAFSHCCCGELLTWDVPESEMTYNVYRDDVLIAENFTYKVGFTGYCLTMGVHTWCVATVCDGVESERTCITEEATVSTRIAADANEGGWISPYGEFWPACGDDKTFIFGAHEGYQIDSVLINLKNDPEVVARGSYTFKNVLGWEDIRVKCSPKSAIEEDEIHSRMLFPNPASTQVFVETEQLEKIEIYNLQGQLLETISGLEGSKNATVNVTKYDAGVYFFKIHAAGTNKTQRVVITR